MSSLLSSWLLSLLAIILDQIHQTIIYDRFLWSWALSLVAISFAVSRKPLLFLGEAERYIEHAVMPIILLLAVNVASAMQLNESFIGAVFCYALIAFLFMESK